MPCSEAAQHSRGPPCSRVLSLAKSGLLTMCGVELLQGDAPGRGHLVPMVVEGGGGG